MDAYWQDDRAAVSVNAVCAMAGVSKPSLYRDFGSEDGLTAAVLERYGQTVLEPLAALLSGPLGYHAKLDALIDIASGDTRMGAGCLFMKMRATRSRFGPRTQTLMAAMETRLAQGYARFFDEAAGSGQWRGGIATDLAAAYLQEQFGLAVSLRAAGNSPESVRAFLALAVSVLR